MDWTYDAENSTGISVARGVQWWSLGTAPKLKIANRASSKSIQPGVQVATAYATNCDDIERMLLLKELAPPTAETAPAPDTAGWLHVSLDYGPTNHPRAQGAVERLGGWLHEALNQL